jgi:hypothetical protein
MNLFEQQARMHARLHRPPPPDAAGAAPLAGCGTPMLAVMRFIEGANLEQCGKLAIHLSARLFELEKRYGGMQAANLNEAAQFAADAAQDISGAMGAEAEAPCRCGRCDACAAARSDEHYDRKRDAG